MRILLKHIIISKRALLTNLETMNTKILKSLSFLFALVIINFSALSITNAATPVLASAKITGSNTVVLVYSEAVYTSLNDYGSFSGALNGRSLTGISGSGTNIITLTFSGSSFASDAIGGVTIASTVTSVSDNAQLGSGPYSVTDGQAPILKTFSMSSNLVGNTFARYGDTLTVTFNSNESIYAPTVTIAGHSISASGSGNGPYTANYTLTTSDTQDIIPVTMVLTDIAGNQGNGAFSFGGGLGPRIVSITSTANSSGVLRVGDSISFVLTLSTASPNAHVSGSYNNIPLTWTTNNGGATYIATYTVQTGNASNVVPLQISGVTIRDAAGNVSVASSGTDIQKTINAQSFTITESSAIASLITTNTPGYGFYSPREGVINYAGDCSSLNRTASLGYNFITFIPLANGLHNNCTITVVDATGNLSNTLAIASFTISASNNTVQPSSSSSTSSVATNLQSQLLQLQAQLASLQSNSSSVSSTSNNASVNSYKFYNALKVGSKGADVIALQERLTAEGVYSGPTNGSYGPLTEAAVKKYQENNGIAKAGQVGYGNVGPNTRAALNK